MIVVDLPLRTSRGLNDRMHWSKRSRLTKRQRGTACLIVQSIINRSAFTLSTAVVTLIRLSAGELDDDNLQGSLKAVRDGVADALHIADNDKRVRWRYAQERCKRGAYGVRVQIEGGS